ncbi:MAG TPA: tripartite tricarboxylate transporter substrate binding protein [Xanthobacteraceae bacterium]|jgi:tripartite-type tricarboxylate transporter receptor subunit TctC|nr:tripartite tricarboxylate transporter substrate binding protein [Xanthobacteraceae bacterium]
MATRRTFLTKTAGLAAAAAVPSVLSGSVRAQQTYPTRPIRMIVPFPPGGPIDTMARLIGEQLTASVGQVVVENRPGAGSTLGTKYVAAAPPDGYTLMFGSSGSLAVAPALYSSLDVDPRKAFAPIARVALLPHVFVVNNEVPAHSIAEFVAYAKANPGKINFGAGLGTPPHLLSTLFKTRANIDVVYIPYNGSAQSVTDLLGGRTQFTIDGLVTLYPLIKAGKVRALAIARGERWPALPDVPTLVESGYPDFVLDAWTGVVAPAGTPAPIVDKLNAAINAALGTEAAKASLAKFSAIANTGTPDDFKRFLADQMEKWGAVVKLAGARVD